VSSIIGRRYFWLLLSRIILAKHGLEETSSVWSAKKLTSGNHMACAGLCWSSLRAKPELTRLANTPPIFPHAGRQKPGLATGLRQCGSITVALTGRRQRGVAQSMGAMARVFRCRGERNSSPSDILSLYPHLNMKMLSLAYTSRATGRPDPGNIRVGLGKGLRRMLGASDRSRA